MRTKLFVLALAIGGLVACSEQGADQPMTKSTALVGQADQAASEAQETTVTESADVTAVQQALSNAAEAAGDDARLAAAAVAASAEDQAQVMQSSLDQQLADGQQAIATDTQTTVDTAVLETGKVTSTIISPEQLDMGKRIYSGNCMTCHSPGIAGAPKLGDTQAWSLRISQGLDTLYDHAINGFKGSAGYMPPKGGYASLNDGEVKAAVAYMVFESK